MLAFAVGDPASTERKPLNIRPSPDLRRRRDMSNAESGKATSQGLPYYPWWLDNLADDATLEGAAMNGTARGAEAVRAIVVKARELYEFQDFSFTDDFGDDGFLEIYDASVQGEPMKVVVT